MSERERAGSPVPGVARRGPPLRSPGVANSSWEEGDPAILAEHRSTLAAAESDAAYRWIAGAVEDRHVLDVGAGAGFGSELLLEAGALSVLGTDPEPRAVEIATRLHGERVRFMVGELLALGLAPGSFGLVVCFEAVETTPDPEGALAALSRLLRPDGLLAVSLPTVPRLDPISGAPQGPLHPAAEWERILRERFSAVRIHHRRSSFASTIVPADSTESQPEISRLNWVGADPGDQRSILALAGNCELPDLPPLASLVGTRDLRAYRDTIAAWEQRARRAEADGAAKHWELVASREAQRRLRKRLWHLEHTPIRKLFRIIRGRPAKLSEGPPIRPPELEPEAWD